jgi:diguanylate cyclase (GGDEF)-like protein/putative nucleotidyltransferase with HDIG domain
MGTFPLPLNLILPGLALILVLALILGRVSQRHAQQERKNTEVLWFSKLHSLSRAFAESRDPRKIAEPALHLTLELLETGEGYVLLEASAPDGLAHAQGLSLATVEGLGRDPLRSYLASSGERWGSLMVFPDLRRPDLMAAWQRDPRCHEFLLLLGAEGLRTLIVVGLQGRERSYGALLVGSRSLRSFQGHELRLVLAIGSQMSVALENWSLHQESERHNEELRLLHRVGEALRATFDLRAQVETLRRELKGLLGTTNFSLALQDSPEGLLETVVPFENHQDAPAGTSADSWAEYVARTRSPVRITADLGAQARRLGVAAVDPRLRTWCGVPIRFSDGSTGVLALADFERELAISDRQFQLLQLLADEAAGAIENARLFQQEQRRASHLALLNELGRKATAVLDPQELLRNICQQVRSAFGYDLTRIEVMDPAGQDELVVEAEAGYGESLLGRRTRLGEGLSGVAAETGEPVLANAVVREARYVALHPGVRSAMSLPLKYREELLGVLSLESRREQAFAARDVLTLRTLADQLAIALHNARAYQVALEEAITDGLTGLKTHRFFMEELDREWRRSTRSGRHFSLIMMDLDGFKQVNDHHGHLEGDRVLTAVAAILDARSRQTNVVARYGGDEFAILMPEAHTDQAETLAERLRASLETNPYLAAHEVTASFGIATFPIHGPTQEEILRVADAGMYLAKHQKGNRVCVASLAGQAMAEAEWEQQLLEAYLGVAVKRLFSTGPEAFNLYLQRFEQAKEAGNGEGPSLLDTVTALAFAIDAKDHYTQGHSQAVSRLAAQLARQLGMSNTEIEEVRLAGILHDVGKIGVPESVLNKPERLSEEEYEQMKSHAALGGKILEPLRVQAIERIRRMVRHHHEAYDGCGYPDRLKGEEIPLGARILTVADCFDTMVSERAYKKGRSIEEAIEELWRCCGAQFDPRLVEAFVESWQSFGDPRKRAELERVAN